MSKKEEKLTKMDVSELKSVDGGYVITCTDQGFFVTGCDKVTGDAVYVVFEDLSSAFVFAESRLLHLGGAHTPMVGVYAVPVRPGAPAPF